MQGLSRFLQEATPAIHGAIPPEGRFQGAGMRLATRMDGRQHLRSEAGRLIGPSGRIGVGPGMEQASCIVRQKTVGVEKILLQSEANEAPLQIARPIPGNAMPEDEIL